MSRLKQEFSRKKFPKLKAQMAFGLSRVDPEAFLQMVWAVWGLQQSKPNALAKRLIEYPPEAVTDDFSSPWAVRSWELETLVNLLVEVDQDPRLLALPCNQFGVAAEFSSLLRKLEDVESGIYLSSDNIFNEMHRIGHRQFSWQRGFANRADFYRYLYLYGLGGCAAFFERHYDLSIEVFTKVGFGLFAQFSNHPLATRPLDLLQVIGVDARTAERAAALMTIPIGAARTELTGIIRDLGAEDQPIAYRPSLLRRRPIIAFGRLNEVLRAPLPPLIMLRISAGLYYDLLAGGPPVRDEIARQFESYCIRFLAAMMPRFDVEPEYRYLRNGVADQVDSPDILVLDKGRLALVIECKATKLTFTAQFAGDPAMAAADKYEELAKGVFQLWRFYSHCRRGLTRHTADERTRAILLTLDTWMVLSRDLQDHVLERARAKAAREPGMELQDQRPVIFAAIQDFERVLVRTDEDGLFRTLSAANEERFLGWLLPNVRQELGEDIESGKPYPFEMGEILPWWKEIEGLRAASTPHGA